MILPILHYPDPRLHRIAAPIAVIDERIRRLAADMAETMYAAPGVGLAATQVDVHERLIVIDVSPEKNTLITLINPQLLQHQGEKLGEEGCLSVPGIYESVKRAETVRLRYLDLNGETHEIDADGLLAVCIQHEIDHLNGIVFVEHLSRLKLSRVVQKLKKRARNP